MRKLLLAVALFLYAVPALGQQVRQTGVVTPGHAPVWATQGVVGDGGTAQNGAFTSLGVTNNGGPGVCVNSAPASSGNYNQICLSATTNAGGTLSLSNVGTATGTLGFVVNGSPLALPVVGLPTALNDAACFSNTAGALFRCNGQMALRGTSSGIVTLAVQATAGTFNFNLPITAGAAGQVLTSGGGVGAPMTWTNPSGSPGGSNTQVQFNNSSSFGGSAAFTWVSPTLTVGASGTGTGVLALAGTTSGVVSVQPQGAAGTWNFNLPTTAGSAGQVLTSQGGGASAMTWTTPVATAAGSNTQVQFNSTGAFGASANLTWVSPALTIGVAGSATGQLVLTGGTSGSTTVQPNVTASGTLTLPAATDTLVGKATTDQFTNKSFLTSFGVVGSSSGTITVQAQANAGTFNWNLPVTAGTANGPLLSGGGGATAMSWGTRSSSGGGATTVFATVSGTLTSGNCITTDAFLNIADAGATCGSGGGGGAAPAATVKDYIAGIDYTAGTTTSLVLPSTPAQANIVQILFDGVVQSHNTWSLSVATVTFNAAIPSNVQVVEASYYTGGGSSSSPGGVTGNLQYNNGGLFGGMVSTTAATSGTLLTITAQAAANIPFLIKGAAAQSGNLQEWRNSGNTLLASVDSAGVVRGASGGVFSTLTDSALSVAGPVLTSAAGLLSSVAVLTEANGGTNHANTYTNGQLLIGNSTGGTLTAATLTAGSGITVTNGGGSITIAATAAGITGPGTSTIGTPSIWNNATGTQLANGKGACNIRAFGADEAQTAANNTTFIQAAVNACGMIYVPSPAGGQTFDDNGIPTFCYAINGAITWPSTKSGGAIGDGPSVSCISSTSATACVFQPQNTVGAYFANMTLRHANTTGTLVNRRASGLSFPGCGIDAGYTFDNNFMTIFNLHTMYNFDGVILGGTGASDYVQGRSFFNQNRAMYEASSINAATLAAKFYGLQWNIINFTAFFNNAQALHIQCISGDIPLQAIIGMRTSFNGGARPPTGTNVPPLFYTLEVDGETNGCNVLDFAIYNSFLGEGGRGEIWFHSGTGLGATATPYIISGVGLESPGNCVVSSGLGNGILAANSTLTGTANATNPLVISEVYEFGCGGISAKGLWISGPTFTTISNSSFQGNVNGVTLGGNVTAGTIMGGVSFTNNFLGGNTASGINVDSAPAALTTHGNRIISGTGTNIVDSLSAGLRSNTGDWCGTTLLSLSACAW